MRAKVLRGGWVWGDVLYAAGDEVDAPEAQIAAWEADGYVRRLPQRAQRVEKVETAEAVEAPENAAARTSKPGRKRKGR
jgi:hypothetical protein